MEMENRSQHELVVDWGLDEHDAFCLDHLIRRGPSSGGMSAGLYTQFALQRYTTMTIDDSKAFAARHYGVERGV